METNNSISTPNPNYTQNIATWTKARDAAEGQDQIKRKGKTYLPIGNGQNENTYKNYKGRAVYYNATQKTVDGLKGAMFRIEPKITFPEQDKFLIDGVTFGGKSITDFAMEVAEDQLKVSRTGILVDYPTESTEGLTVAEAEAIGQRPYLSMYPAESIINWRYEVVSNGVRLKQVVLKETIEDDNYLLGGDQKYKVEYKDQYRELYLDENGVYKQRVYADLTSGTKDETLEPKWNGQPMGFIPFLILTPNGEEYRDIYTPVIKDLADMNIAHYVNSADREQEIYWAGVKTPCFPGWQADEAPSMGEPIGTPPDQSPFMLEAGAGSTIQEEMVRKEERMAVLGAQIIAQSGRYVQSATTAEISKSSEESVLGSISDSISRVLSKAMKWLYDWYKNTDINMDDVKIELNKDFNPTAMGAPDMLALVQMWQSKAISKKTLFGNLQKGERIPMDTTFEEEEKAIEENPPEDNPLDSVIV